MAFSLRDKTVKVGLKIVAAVAMLVLTHLTAQRIVFGPLEKARRETEAAQRKLDDTRVLLRDNPDARSRTQEITAKMEALREKSVTSKELPRIIQQLTKKSSELKMDIISIRPIEKIGFQETSLPQGISKAYIEVVAKTPYKTLGEYFKALKEMSIVFTVEGITLERATDENDTIRRKETGEEKRVVATMLISSYTIWQF